MMDLAVSKKEITSPPTLRKTMETLYTRMKEINTLVAPRRVWMLLIWLELFFTTLTVIRLPYDLLLKYEKKW